MSLRARHVLLAGAAGLLYPLCFPNFDLHVLAWVALVPLHVALDGLSPRRAFWIGWLAGTIAFLGAMAWVVTAMHVYGQMALPLSYAALGLLSLYLGLFVAAYAGVFAIGHRAWPTGAWLMAPAVWVGLELLRTYAFSGLPWALLGYSQATVLPVIQFADATGVYGISFLIVLVNAAVAQLVLWLLARRPAPAPWQVQALTVAALSAILLYGESKLASDTAGETGTVRVGVVQPNIDQAHKWDRAFANETIARYVRLTGEVAPGSDLVIWPEAATPFLFEQEAGYRAEIAALAGRAGVPILFGSPALRFYDTGRPYLLNSAYLFSSDGRILGRYDKRHLVPFGEYIPLKSILFFLNKLVVGIGDFEAGTVPTVLRLPPRVQPAGPEATVPPAFGVVICFEVIFPDLVRDFVRDGAAFMVTITNDAWFGDSAAPHQHFGMVILRSVENGVSFARAANTGISGFIDPFGRVLAATPIFAEQALAADLPAGHGPTIYSRYGDVFAYGCAIIGTLFLAHAMVRARRRGARGIRE